MTSRLFLTLLAFLTGFAVQNAPAEARVLRQSGTEIGAVAASSAALAGSVAATAACLDVRHDRPETSTAGPVCARSSFDQEPAVRVGIDRARE